MNASAKAIRDVIRDLLADPEAKIEKLDFIPIVGNDLKHTLHTRVDIRIHAKAEAMPSANAPPEILRHDVSSDGCLTISQTPVVGEDGERHIKTQIIVTGNSENEVRERISKALTDLPLADGFRRAWFHFQFPVNHSKLLASRAELEVVDKQGPAKTMTVIDFMKTWQNPAEAVETWIEKARNLLPAKPAP